MHTPGREGQSIEIDRRGSQEVAHRGNRAVRVEPLVLPIGKTHEPLGCADRGIEPLPNAIGTMRSSLPCSTKVGTVIALTHASERNWSFIKRPTGISG
jgi:hypothetical protein